MSDFLKHDVLPHFNFWIYVILMMIGLYAMIAKNNLVKKLIGMSIFQSAIILFYVSIGVKNEGNIQSHGGEIPILRHAAISAAAADPQTVDPRPFANPLPHVLMLTAIVVAVATLGVALAVVQRIYRDFHTLEEDQILEKIKARATDV